MNTKRPVHVASAQLPFRVQATGYLYRHDNAVYIAIPFSSAQAAREARDLIAADGVTVRRKS